LAFLGAAPLADGPHQPGMFPQPGSRHRYDLEGRATVIRGISQFDALEVFGCFQRPRSTDAGTFVRVEYRTKRGWSSGRKRCCN